MSERLVATFEYSFIEPTMSASTVVAIIGYTLDQEKVTLATIDCVFDATHVKGDRIELNKEKQVELLNYFFDVEIKRLQSVKQKVLKKRKH